MKQCRQPHTHFFLVFAAQTETEAVAPQTKNNTSFEIQKF